MNEYERLLHKYFVDYHLYIRSIVEIGCGVNEATTEEAATMLDNLMNEYAKKQQEANK